MRNTRVIDIYNDLIEFGLDVTVYDPWVSIEEVQSEYSIEVINRKSEIGTDFSVIVLAVSHDQYLEMEYDKIRSKKSVLIDIKGFLPLSNVDFRL